jgi:hypothetical protein
MAPFAHAEHKALSIMPSGTPNELEVGECGALWRPARLLAQKQRVAVSGKARLAHQ